MRRQGAPARCKYRRFERLANGRTNGNYIILAKSFSYSHLIDQWIDLLVNRTDYLANTRICQWFGAEQHECNHSAVLKRIRPLMKP